MENIKKENPGYEVSAEILPADRPNASSPRVLNIVLQEKLRQLPDHAGVYLMKDKDNKVIYVGKATSLKNRVRSYFQAPHRLNAKTAALVEKIEDLETIIVAGPRDALILESNLIKEHKPHYNIQLRDDKHYPYLKLTMTEDYPRLLVARSAKNDGNRYFGPYVSSNAMNHACNLIKKIFPIRSCKYKNWSPNHRPCLNFHIGICSAPCAGKITKEQYRDLVEQVGLFLQGKTGDVSRSLKGEMEKAAQELRFEDAARLRDIYLSLEQLGHQQELDRSDKGEDFDILASAIGNGQGVAQIFFVRQGKVVGRDHFFLLNAQAGEENILNNRFLWDYYGSGDKIPRHIYLNVLPENSKELMELFSETIGHKVDFLVPQRGDKKRLLNLVEKNAQLVLRQHLENSQYQEEKAALALEDLRRRLDLPKTPIRIECYDISHIQGSNTVGSMVVFSNGLADKRLYRHFKIKTVQGINDFASLQEVLRRRLQRGLDERAAAKEKLDFGIFPDLFLIDGGKGQLSAVGEVLSALGFGHIPVISLAEREEEVFIPQRSLPLDFPLDSDASKLLRRIRDEAHRFAITYHRNLRSKSQVTSFLDAAPGIGKARRQNLLQTFGSLEQIKKASLEELSQAPAMNKKVAGELYAFLHPHNQKEDI